MALFESLSFMLNMMLKMQQASLSKQLETQIKLNERLVATIEDLQLTIKDLKRQLGQNSNIALNRHQKMILTNLQEIKALEKKQEKRPVDKRATKASV